MREKYKAYARKNFLSTKGFKQSLNFIRTYFSLRDWKIKHPPLLAILILTRRCNLRCEMCNLWKYKNNEMSKEEIFRLVNDLEKLGVTTISISGGEPLMREDVFEIMNYVKGKGMFLDISTNGTLITNSVAKKITEIGVDTISVSLDSDDPEIFDRLRGIKGAHDKAVLGIKNLLNVSNNKTRITVNILLSPQTLDRLLETVNFLSNLGIKNIGFIPVHNFNMKKSLSFSECQKNKLEEIVNKIVNIEREKGIIDNTEKYLETIKKFILKGERSRACGAGFLTVVIDSNGDIYPCFGMFELGKKIGNIHNLNIKDFWYSELYETLRLNLLNCKECVWNCQEELNIVFDSVLRRKNENIARKPGNKISR